MKKIYVLNVIGGLSKGGAEYQCSLLCDNLNSEQFKSKILCFQKGPSPLSESLNNVIFISRGEKWDLLSLFSQMYSIIKSEAPDIIHVWLPEIISVPAALIGKFLGIPIVASHRNSTKFSGDIIKYIRDRIRFIQYIVASKIISNFHINEEPLFFRLLFKQKEGEVIFNGKKEMIFTSDQKPRENNKTSELLFVGRLAPEKNLPLLLKSLSILKKENHSFKLRIFGDGDPTYKLKLNELISKLGLNKEVDFLGFNSSWHLFAPRSLCLLLPSKSEGTANVIIESLNIGLPIIISNIPMSRSILKHEFNAIIVKQAVPTVWAEKIIQLSKNKILTDRIKRNGIEYSKQFSNEKMVSKYEYSYKQLINYTNNDFDY